MSAGAPPAEHPDPWFRRSGALAGTLGGAAFIAALALALRSFALLWLALNVGLGLATFIVRARRTLFLASARNPPPLAPPRRWVHLAVFLLFAALAVLAAAPSPRPDYKPFRTHSIAGDIVGNIGCAIGQAAAHKVAQQLKVAVAIGFLLIVVAPPLLAHDLGRARGFRAGMLAAGRSPLGDPTARR